MTNDDKNSRKNFSFRMKMDLSNQIEQEAAKLGMTKNAFITMILHNALNGKKSS